MHYDTNMEEDNIIPDFIKNYGLYFNWDKNKLWALTDIPVESINISEIEWQLDLPFWHEGKNKYSICPRSVLNDIENYPKHKERILNADIRYPIDLIENINGDIEILDGLHRLCHLIILNETKARVRKIPRSLIPLIIN